MTQATDTDIRGIKSAILLGERLRQRGQRLDTEGIGTTKYLYGFDCYDRGCNITDFG